MAKECGMYPKQPVRVDLLWICVLTQCRSSTGSMNLPRLIDRSASSRLLWLPLPPPTHSSIGVTAGIKLFTRLRLKPLDVRPLIIFVGVGNKVLMSNNGGETRGIASSETTTEITMGIASPKIDDVRKDALAILILIGVKLNSLSEPLTPITAPLQA